MDVPSQSTYPRFFNRFNNGGNHRFFTSLQQWFFSELQLKNLTVDFESSVVTPFGMVLNARLGHGKTHSSNNFESFAAHTLKVAAAKQIRLARFEIGFYSNSIFIMYMDNINKRHKPGNGT
jgi:hypothetical protein